MSFVSDVGAEKLTLMKKLKNLIKTFIDVSEMKKSSHKTNTMENLTSIYDITVMDLYSKDVHLSKYKGKVLLIVNYAETTYLAHDNVENLSRLALKYGYLGFQVLMFPSNTFYDNFGGNNAGIRLKREHPEFDVFSQVNVNGYHTHLLYKYLKNKLPGRVWKSEDITTSFFKFLIDRNGKPYQRFNSLELFESIEEAMKEVLIKDFRFKL
ncbi:Thioredoxin-like fold,Glutathione peroxidase [Cinara cedri]|uniref:Thioredoxin-like fold,Glutathione peroxidase n=1 Tax=Cinara cedri TaxID=506608 RepID=A0A5E4NDJ1_9HEMI|nr:Thioredoxin-like fold,Glutathione peroxidase [Cinara cedri]